MLQLAEALAVSDEHERTIANLKRKVQRSNQELGDVRLHLEEQLTRNADLEKKQRKWVKLVSCAFFNSRVHLCCWTAMNFGSVYTVNQAVTERCAGFQFALIISLSLCITSYKQTYSDLLYILFNRWRAKWQTIQGRTHAVSLLVVEPMLLQAIVLSCGLIEALAFL